MLRPSFRFRLRTLLVFMALLAVPCAYVGRRVEAMRELEAAEAREAKLGWRFAVNSMPPLRKPNGVILPVGATSEDFKRAEREFPDMQIIPTVERFTFRSMFTQRKRPKIIFTPPQDSHAGSLPAK